MTDGEAVEALLKGDRSALAALVERHELRALRLAYHITRDREMAKDVVADAFLAVLQHIHRSDPARPFEPWFVRIVTNRAISLARRASRYETVRALIARRIEPLDPEAEVLRNEAQQALAAAMKRLHPNERAALALRYYLDLDEQTMAETLGWPLGTVKTRLHRGRAHLRRQLENDTNTRWILNATEGE